MLQIHFEPTRRWYKNACSITRSVYRTCYVHAHIYMSYSSTQSLLLWVASLWRPCPRMPLTSSARPQVRRHRPRNLPSRSVRPHPPKLLSLLAPSSGSSSPRRAPALIHSVELACRSMRPCADRPRAAAGCRASSGALGRSASGSALPASPPPTIPSTS